MLDQLAKSYAMWLNYVVNHRPEVGKKILIFLLRTCLKQYGHNDHTDTNIPDEAAAKIPTLITNLSDLIQVLSLAKVETWKLASECLLNNCSAQELMTVVTNILLPIPLDTYGRGESLFTQLIKTMLAQEGQLADQLKILIVELANSIKLSGVTLTEKNTTQGYQINYEITHESILKNGFEIFLSNIPKAIERASERVKAIYSLVLADIQTKQKNLDQTNNNLIVAFFTIRLINPIIIKFAGHCLTIADEAQKMLWATKIIPKMVQGITADLMKGDIENIVPNCLLQLLLDNEFKQLVKEAFLSDALSVNHLLLIDNSPKTPRPISLEKNVFYTLKVIEARSLVGMVAETYHYDLNSSDIILSAGIIKNLFSYINNLLTSEDNAHEENEILTKINIVENLIKLVEVVNSAVSQFINTQTKNSKSINPNNMDNNFDDEGSLYQKVNEIHESLSHLLSNEAIMQLVEPFVNQYQLVNKLIVPFRFEELVKQEDALCKLSLQLADIYYIYNAQLKEITHKNAYKIEHLMAIDSPIAVILENQVVFIEQYRKACYQIAKSHLKEMESDNQALAQLILDGKSIVSLVQKYNTEGLLAINMPMPNDNQDQTKEIKKSKKLQSAIKEVFKKVECKLL